MTVVTEAVARVLRTAARALRVHAHVDAARWAAILDGYADRPALPILATPDVLDVLAGLSELARVPVVTADALLPNSIESASDLGAMLALRNSLLEASLMLLNGLAAEMPTRARLN
jgi:hypothetical protein